MGLLAAPHVARSEAGGSEAAKRQAFMQWMVENGANVEAVSLQPSGSGEGNAGNGLFAAEPLRRRLRLPWLGNRLGSWLSGQHTVTVLDVPLSIALTASNVVADPQLGGSYAQLLEQGQVDERGVVMLWMVVERLRGKESKFGPYIAMLPQSFDTPIWYSQRQLAELKGTTLAKAVSSHRRALEATWANMQPHCRALLKQLGVTQEPSLEDFLWASTAFWSRAQSLPTPMLIPAALIDTSSSDAATMFGKSPAPADAAAEGADVAAGTNDSSAYATSGGDAGGGARSRLRIVVQEGMVPGIDFCNHSQWANCWWEVNERQPTLAAATSPSATDASARSSSQPTSSLQQQQQHQQQEESGRRSYSVQLMTNRRCCPKPGEELFISYGDKSNEELLMLYGFAVPGNPHDMAMVTCPLPPQHEWDDTLCARMDLLQVKGLRPQFFLSASFLQSHKQQQASQRSSAQGSHSPGVGSKRASCVPPQARQVLEVFVLDVASLSKVLHEAVSSLEQQGLEVAHGGSAAAARATSLSGSSGSGARSSNSGSSSSSSKGSSDSMSREELSEWVEHLGMDMAVITTFVRLLEVKLYDMEDTEEGTGPLESDLALLGSSASTNSSRVAAVGTDSEMGQKALEPWHAACVAYRAGQKQLVRDYLAAARQELHDTLEALQAAVEAENQHRRQ